MQQIPSFGKFGILTAKLIDPLSILIDNIFKNEDCNTIGFYYTIENNDCIVFLFDIYDTYPIKWAQPFYTMLNILSSPYIKNITCYSMNLPSRTLFNSPNKNNQILEEKFSNIVNGILIGADKNRDYNFLLLKVMKHKIKSGYNLINKVLSLLSKNPIILPNFETHELITNKISFNINNGFINDINDSNILDICNKEIYKLNKRFNKLFSNNREFASSIDLSSIPLSLDNISSIDTTNYGIKNIGNYLSQLVNSTNKNEQALAIKNMTITYNNLILGTNLKMINLPEKINSLLEPNIIDVNSEISEIISVINININSYHETDLKPLSAKQLFDILIYIDSLRDTNGTTDTRFSGIQNLIVKELSRRK